MKWKKCYSESEEKSLIQKGIDFGTDTIKKEIVSLLTGGQVLQKIGTILDILEHVPGLEFDRSKADDKIKDIIKLQENGVQAVDSWIKKIPLLEDLFGDEKDFIKNVCRFGLFTNAINIGSYPSDNYNLSTVLAVQSTLIAIMALTTVTMGGWITATFGVGLWISCYSYNKVFEKVEGDVKKFEKWCQDQGVNVDKQLSNVKKGNAIENKSSKDKEQVNEFVGALVKGASKLLSKGISKGIAKSAAKSAAKSTAKKADRTTTGKVLQKIAPKLTKGVRKISASVLKKIKKISPKTAQILRKQGPSVVDYCVANGLSDEEVLGYIGDFISDCQSKASEQDKSTLDVMKDELSSGGKTREEVVDKFKQMVRNTIEK